MSIRPQDATAGSYPAGSYDDGREDVAQVVAEEAARRTARRTPTGAYLASRRREFNPNSDKPVCQGGPRWYV